MFARAGISGRILRGRDGRASSVALHPFLARPKKKDKTKCYCYVPFIWQALVAILVGLLVLMAGTAMTTTGYYYKRAADLEALNTHANTTFNLTTTTTMPTTTVIYTYHNPMNLTELETLHNLSYAGPVLMGVGCFVVVISCVHVCDERDKKIKEFEERRKAEEAKRGGKAKKSKNKVYDLIIKQLNIKDDRKEKTKTKKKEEQTHEKEPPDLEAGTASAKSTVKGKHKEILKGFLRRCSGISVSSTKSEYSNISIALRRIPMDIFTVDLDGNKDTSLQPILVPRPKPLGNLVLSPKYPSDPCLARTTSKKRKPLPWLAKPTRPPEEEGRLTKSTPAQHSDNTADIVPIPSTSSHQHSTLIDIEFDPPKTKDKTKSTHPLSRSVSPPLLHRHNEDSPSNVIVHQASVHYDGMPEDILLPITDHKSSGTSEDKRLEIRADKPNDTATHIIDFGSDSEFDFDEDNDNEDDNDSLGLDDVLLSSFEPSDAHKSATPSPQTTPRVNDVENWEGDRVLKEWREHNGTAAKPPIHPSANNMGRRATIATGEHGPLLQPPQSAGKHLMRQAGGARSPQARGWLQAPQRNFHIRTDPMAPELTVRVTQVPYSNHLYLGKPPPGHHAPPGHPVPEIPRLYKVNTSPDLVRQGSLMSKRKPICDLHNKPARAFNS